MDQKLWKQLNQMAVNVQKFMWLKEELYQMIRENTTTGQTILVIGVGNTIGVSQ